MAIWQARWRVSARVTGVRIVVDHLVKGGHQPGWAAYLPQAASSPLGAGVCALHLAVADALPGAHQHGGAVVEGGLEGRGAVDAPYGGVEDHGGELARGPVIPRGGPHGQRLMTAADVGGDLVPLRLTAAEGLPEGRPLRSGRCDDVLHVVVVEHFHQDFAAVHDALRHVAASLLLSRPWS